MIDLIIPCYNAEDTIGRALASVAAQTKPRKFLVTVVDDCSTDCTAAVVNKFKGIIPLQYIKLEKNLGKPGLVRNEGIRKTSCPYIMFLDADDVLLPTAGEFLTRAAIQQKPDMIVGQFFGETLEQNEEEQYKLYDTNAMTWLHGNLYKRDFLDSNGIEFDNRMNEDGSFNVKCLNLTKNIYHIKQPMAYWMNNRKSLTRSNDKFMLDITKDYIETYTDAIKFVFDRLPDKAKEENFKNICAYKFAEFCEFIEANFSYKRDTKEFLTLLKNYTNLLKEYQIIDNNFIKGANERYNMTKIFLHILRTHCFTYYLDEVSINYDKGEFNG